jgi:phosphatidylglycerol lysyltransferase
MRSYLHWRPGSPLRRGFTWLRAHIVTLWLASLPLLILLVGIRQWNEIQSVLSTLRGAHPRWLLAGIGIETLIVLSPALTYRVILSRLGHVLPFHSLVSMHMQRIVVGTLAPVSGPVSAFAFVRALNRRSVTTHDALTMLALRSVSTQCAFVVLLLSAIALRGPIYTLCVATFAILVLVAVVPLVRRARIPACVGPWCWRRNLPRSVSPRVIEFVARFRRHRIRPSDLSRPLAITITTRFAGLLLLIISIKAMGVDVAPKAVAMAVMAEMVAKVAMPVFHGIGVVEAATALALQQSGVPAEAAVGAALLWRAFEFWLPLTAALLSQGAVMSYDRLSLPALARQRVGAWGIAFLSAVGIRRAVPGASEAS